MGKEIKIFIEDMKSQLLELEPNITKKAYAVIDIFYWYFLLIIYKIIKNNNNFLKLFE